MEEIPPPLPSLKSNLAFMWTIETFISKIQFQSLQFNFVLLSMISFNQCHKEIKVICMLLIIRLERWRDVKTTYLGFHIIWRPNFQPSTVSTLTSQILMKWYSFLIKKMKSLRVHPLCKNWNLFVDCIFDLNLDYLFSLNLGNLFIVV